MDKEDIVYVYTNEYYSAIKKNEIMPLEATWMGLEIIIVSVRPYSNGLQLLVWENVAFLSSTPESLNLYYLMDPSNLNMKKKLMLYFQKV